jgi:hypothetical protein
MRKLAALAALQLAGTPAIADTVTISLSENGGAYTTYNNVSVTSLFGVPFGNWIVYAREAGGADPGTQGFEVNLFNSRAVVAVGCHHLAEQYQPDRNPDIPKRD